MLKTLLRRLFHRPKDERATLSPLEPSPPLPVPKPAEPASPSPTGTEPPPPAAKGKIVLPGSDGGPFAPLHRIAEIRDGHLTPSCLFFGDSVFLRVADEDADRRPLGVMLEDDYPGPGQGLHIAFSAFNLRLYDALHAVLENAPSPPGTVVVPINMRSFSPQWHDNPPWRFDAHLRLIRDAANDPRAPLGPVDPVRECPGMYDAFRASRVSYALSPLDSVGAFLDIIARKPETEDERRRRLETIMVFHYTHALTQEHPLLANLDALAVRGASLGQRILPVVVPVNMELGLDVVGPAFRDIVLANTRLVNDRWARHGLSTLCLIDALPGDAFFHTGSPTEHLREEGRKALRDRILEEIGG